MPPAHDRAPVTSTARHTALVEASADQLLHRLEAIRTMGTLIEEPRPLASFLRRIR